MERSKGRRAIRVGLAQSMRRIAASLVVVAALAVTGARAEEVARVDLNTASVAELTGLPGIGPAKAEAIVEYRETAPFKSADELVQVKGIGEKLYEQLKDKVTVGTPPARAASAGAPQDGAAAGAANGRTAAASGAR